METKRGIGDLRGVVLRIGATVAICEAVLTLILTVRLHPGYGYPWDRALWHGGFLVVLMFVGRSAPSPWHRPWHCGPASGATRLGAFAMGLTIAQAITARPPPA